MNTVKIIFLSFCIWVSTSKTYSQTIQVSGTINSNTTWSADTVKITGDITVDTGVMLTIESGAYVEAQGYYKIKVSGSIRAFGTSTDSITFTVHDSTNFWSPHILAGGWAGFNLSSNSGSDTSIFEYCKFMYGKKYDTISENIEGGVMKANNYGTLIIKNSFFTCNMVINHEYISINGPCAKGGALYCANVNSVTIDKNRFERNRSFDRGGAIYIGNNCPASVTNNTFIRNKSWNSKIISGVSVSWGAGAAIESYGYDGQGPVISGNFCFNNYTVSGVIVTLNTNGLVYNNIICNNFGSGIEATYYFSTVRIFNNTIINNESLEGGIFLYSNAIVYNNIVWGNQKYPGAMEDQIQKLLPGTIHPVLFNNCVQYGNGGTNSTNSDPDFVNPSEGMGIDFSGSEADWSLNDISPCVNRGTSDTVGLHIPEFDISGNIRIYGVRIDLGCYENQNVLLGINDAELTDYEKLVYPNPGSSQLHFVSNNFETFFELVSMSGQILIQKKFSVGTYTINTESLKPGMYLYRQLSSKNEVVRSGIWVKTDN